MRRSLHSCIALFTGMSLASCSSSDQWPQESIGTTQQAILSGGVWQWSTNQVLVRPGNSTSYYRYAPSIVQTAPGVRFAYYCGNWYANTVQDEILFSTSTQDVNGTWSPWTASARAVWGTQNAIDWDQHHICDPEFVMAAGVNDSPQPHRFHARTIQHPGGADWNLAMFYTGTALNEAKGNSIGVAFANSASGPWERLANAQGGAIAVPGLTMDHFGCSANDWGVGQPSVTAVSGSRVLVFYTVGCASSTWSSPSGPTPYNVPHTFVRELDLNDTSGTFPWLTSERLVPTDGLKDLGQTVQSPDPFIHNASFIYDASHDAFFMVRYQHPDAGSTTPQGDKPLGISYAVDVSWIPGGAMWGATGLSWSGLGNIDWAYSPLSVRNSYFSQPRNHDAGLARTPFGTIIDPNFVEVFYAGSADYTGTQYDPEGLWTYDIYNVRMHLLY